MLPRADIEELEAAHAANPSARDGHRALAREVTTLVHGAGACADAQRASDIMFGGALDGITEELFQDVAGELPTKTIERSKLEAGIPLIDLLVHAALATSKGQARKDIDGGGIYLNNRREAQSGRVATTADLLFGRYVLLRKGKRTYAVIEAR